jgi:hypothetical protein
MKFRDGFESESASSILFAADGSMAIRAYPSGNVVFSNIVYSNGSISDMASSDEIPILNSDGQIPESAVGKIAPTSGGLSLMDPNGGFYVLSSSGAISQYLSERINFSDIPSALVAQNVNPLSACDTWISAETSSCPDGKPISILTSLRVHDAGESVGSLLMMCSSFREDHVIPGWICNPSTGYSARFSVPSETLSSQVVAITNCPNCNPEQVFLLTVIRGAKPSDPLVVLVDSIAVGELIDSVSDSGRIRLFSLSSPSYLKFHSITAIPDPLSPEDKVLMYISGTDLSDSKTFISLFAITLKPQVAERFNAIESNGLFFVVFFLIVLVSAVIIIPLAIRLSPKIQTKLRDWEWIKYKDQLGLEDDLSDDEYSVPRKFSVIIPTTPTKKLSVVHELPR